MNVDFPFHVDHRHRTAQAPEDDHVRDLIEQLLLTGPGERVNRPTFGCGLQQLVFAGNSPELAATVQFMVQGNLQQYLGEVIAVEAVKVDAIDAALEVQVDYVIRRTGELRRGLFTTGPTPAP
jgi:phage baseplate assembly protein W